MRALKKTKHAPEAALLWLLFFLLRLLTLDRASALASMLARRIGPLFPAHRVARRNIEMVLPHISKTDIDIILRGMWDNLGRVIGELPHLPGSALAQRITIHGGEHVPPPGQAALYFSGHIGNWELLPMVSAMKGTPLAAIYRAANNPLVDRMITRLRESHSPHLFPKGAQGAVKLARAIKNNEAIAMLVDQKMRHGIPVPFFGRIAMTAPAIAELALRYDMPIIPARCMRTRGAHFEATIYPPLAYEKTGDHARDVMNIMTAINTMLEGWIREQPAQWFWVHKRWLIKDPLPPELDLAIHEHQR